MTYDGYDHLRESADEAYNWHLPACPFYGQPEGEPADDRCRCPRQHELHGEGLDERPADCQKCLDEAEREAST